MCNLGMAVELNGVNRGIAQGKEQSLLDSIKKMMKNLKLTDEKSETDGTAGNGYLRNPQRRSGTLCRNAR